MRKVITAIRWRGRCRGCGAALARGAPAVWYGRGELECIDCAGSCAVCGGVGELAGGRPCSRCDGTGAALPPADHPAPDDSLPAGMRRDTDGTPMARFRPYPGARRLEWRRGYSATGIRCEDAPCCGCCD